MKKILLALAGVAAVAAPIAFSATTATAAADNSTLNCNNFGGNNRCTATDPDGINYIRVIDPATGALVKSIDLNCADNVTKKGFNFPDSGAQPLPRPHRGLRKQHGTHTGRPAAEPVNSR